MIELNPGRAWPLSRGDGRPLTRLWMGLGWDPLPNAVRGPRLLKLLGTPEKDKRLVFVDSGHSVQRSRETVREILAWLDRHLGPVATSQ